MMICSLGNLSNNPVRDHPNALDQHLLVPAESRPTENVVLVLVRVFRPRRPVVDVEDLVSRIAGVQVNRDLESFGTRQHGLEIGVVEEFLPDVPVRQCAQEAVSSNRALQFVRSCLRALQGQRGESLEAARILCHWPLYEQPVETVGKVDPLLPRDILHRRRVR
jgi:hypothetical protein